MSSLYGAPMATRLPLSDKATDEPEESDASPFISAPTCVQALPFQSYTRT
ncbi:MAG: hypothetical protein R2798_13055 [Chitinophagales bacterium]